MPNWNSNHMVVTGPKEDLAKLKADAMVKEKGIDQFGKEYEYSSDFSFQKLLPLEHGNNWYEERYKKWGIKWDVDASCDWVDERGDCYRLSYYFDSPWCPPIAGINNVSKLYPTLTFELFYDEPGMGFFGDAVFRNGECTDNCQEYTEGYCTSCGASQSVGPDRPSQECWECYKNTIVTKDEYEASVKSGVIKDLRKEGE